MDCRSYSHDSQVPALRSDAGSFRGCQAAARSPLGLWRPGQPLETVQALLGHFELDHLMPYLEVNTDTLREMFDVVL